MNPSWLFSLFFLGSIYKEHYLYDEKYTRILVLFLFVLWYERSLRFNIFPYSSQFPLVSPYEEFPTYLDSILRELYLPPQLDDKPAYHQREQVQFI